MIALTIGLSTSRISHYIKIKKSIYLKNCVQMVLRMWLYTRQKRPVLTIMVN